MTVARLLRENLKVPFPMVRKILDGLNVVQIALKLTAYFLALCLPLWPSFAQERTEPPTSPLDLDSVQTRQFDLPSNFRLTSSSAELNLIPEATPLVHRHKSAVHFQWLSFEANPSYHANKIRSSDPMSSKVEPQN